MTEKKLKTLTANASFVRVKELNSEERLIEGVASSPVTDRVGDIVVPTGAQFKLPIPLLIDHDHHQAVGEVTWAKATATGIRFRARIAIIEKPGAAKDLTDFAWDLVKSGLRKTVSIGFRVLPGGYEAMADGGTRFNAWEWFELSLVAVPANPEARIESFKSGGLTPPPSRPPRRPVKLESMASIGAKKLAKSKRSIVYLTPPAERECKRLDERIREIDRMAKKLDAKVYNSPFDHDLQNHVADAQRQLETEKSFHRQRRVGIEAGLIPVTEKQARADLIRSAESAAPIQAKAAPAAAPSASKPWQKHVPTEDDAPWSVAADRGVAKMQEVLSSAGIGPDSIIRATNFKNLVGMALGLASEAFRQVQAVNERLAEIEAAGIKFAGVWQRAVPYDRGSVVVHQGSSWVALKAAPEGEMPGQAPDHWQLMVKAGRDGKDATPAPTREPARAVKL